MDSWISGWRQSNQNREKQKRRIIFFVIFCCVLAVVTVTALAYNWLRKDIVIIVDGREKRVKTFQRTVGEVLVEEEIELNEADNLSHAYDTILEDGMVITIKRAFPVFIEIAGKRQPYKTIPATVGKILEGAEIILDSDDFVNPPTDTLIDSTKIIKVTRVTKKEWTEEIKLPYEVKYQRDANLERGYSEVVRKGKEGLLERKWLVIYHDDEEYKREVVSEKVIEEPVEQIVRVGTKSVVSRGGRRIEFEKAMFVVATAYTHTGNTTYTGVLPKKGTVAVDPRLIPLGSKLYVEGYGYAEAQDIGSAIKGNRIDLFMESRDKALKWGRRKVKVYILK